MNYRRLDKQTKRKGGFGIMQTFFCIILIAVLAGIGFFFGTPIANGYYALRQAVFPVPNDTVSPDVENSMMIELQSENDQLKEYFNRATDKEQMTLAAVLVRPPQTPYDSIVIDAGSALGVQAGDVVYADMDFAIGTISSVSAKTSVVTLFSSSGQKESVLIGTSTTAVTAEGRGGGNFYIKVPRNLDIAVGDPVVWPDIDTILLGTVAVVDTGSGDAYSQVYFTSPVDINSLRYVEFKTPIN